MTTPQQIESFKKGLELGLVPSGWESVPDPEGSWPFCFWCRLVNGQSRDLYPEDATALDIEAMEGLAGRVLIEALFVMQWTDSWRLFSYGIPHGKLPGDKDDTLTPLVAAVERLRG